MILSEFRINNQEKVPKEKPLAAPVQGTCTLCLLWFTPNDNEKNHVIPSW